MTIKTRHRTLAVLVAAGIALSGSVFAAPAFAETVVDTPELTDTATDLTVNTEVDDSASTSDEISQIQSLEAVEDNAGPTPVTVEDQPADAVSPSNSVRALDAPVDAAQTAPAAKEYDGVLFRDVDRNHKFATAIYWMAAEGLTTGTRIVNTYGNTVYIYEPSANLSREAMAAFLYRQAGKPSFTQPARDFTDVKPGSKFYREISWMRAAGLSTGYADGSYKPKESLSRGAMAAFMYRQKGEPNFTSKGNFTDTAGTKFATAIQWMRATGRSTGYADGSYRPNDAITREAMAAFLYRDAGSPKMPPIPSEVVLVAYCGSSTVTYRRSLGWDVASAIADAQARGCQRWTEVK